MKITGNETLQQVYDQHQQIITEFEKIGLGAYFKSESLAKIGKYTRVSTLLKSINIDSTLFINELNRLAQANDNTPDETIELKKLHFMAMLPCGLRNPFKEYIEAHIANNATDYSELNYLIEGNVNHELSFYPLMDSITDPDELPDIFIASDVNNFFHQPFTESFINKEVFQTFTPYTPNKYLEKAGYADPEHNFTMLTANMLIMVVDKIKLGNRKIPKSWEDLLSPEFQNDIIMRGEDDFFCNAVMLPFYKDHGLTAIKQLATNIKSGKHPAEMVKLAGTDNEEGATIYIMPYFFAQRIKNKNIQVVWPEDGAIASPVFLLAKKEAHTKHAKLLNFLLSHETGELLQERYFPSIHPNAENSQFPEQVKWLGWEFLKQNNIGKLKETIRKEFLSIWETKQ